jgi:adenylate cyclase
MILPEVQGALIASASGGQAESRLRWITGLVLFAFATSHLISHATGLFGLDTLDAVGRRVILAPWRTVAGHAVVFGSLTVHATLGLIALYRRRHLRIPTREAWQLGCGLMIPLLMLPHAINVRIGAAAYGLDESYYRILYQYWLTSPGIGLTRQALLLALVWVHASIGLHFRLRLRPGYARARPWLAAGAVLIPFLALLGLVNAGWDTTVHTLTESGFAEEHGPPEEGSLKAAALADIATIWTCAQITWIAMVAMVLLLRFMRNLKLHRHPLRLTYPGGRVVNVPVGFSILEASRWAGIPHASVCGGRGRCSTCRIRVGAGRDMLPDPGPVERATLRRISAPEGVRLACQLRPDSAVSVDPLLPWDVKGAGRFAPDIVRETHVIALFVDLRDSTRLAAERLPFDALYIIDSYVQCVTTAVKAHRGVVASVAGDGIMCVFGLTSNDHEREARAGADRALAAALAIWQAIDRLSEDLAHELAGPLAFGIGLHSGQVAAGTVLEEASPTMLFLGDTGNVAARLESLTKKLSCPMILSQAVLDAALLAPPDVRIVDLPLRGRSVPVACVTITSIEEGLSLYGQASGPDGRVVPERSFGRDQYLVATPSVENSL